MSHPHASQVKSDVLRRELAKALAGGDHGYFFSLLRAHSAADLRPNVDLADALGVELARAREQASPLVADMLREGADTQAHDPRPGDSFLAVVVAFTLVHRIAQGFREREAWQVLADLAEDTRRPVRLGVVAALVRLSSMRPRTTIADELSPWMQSLLQAAVVLEVLSSREVLDRLDDHDTLIARFDEALSLISDAPRSAQRSQGYRELVGALRNAIPHVVPRAHMIGWLEQACATDLPDLREAFEAAYDGLRKVGMHTDELDKVRAALDARAPKLRDPTHYKGPTRGRGRKAERRAERK